VQIAIENAINYDKCHPKQGDEKLACLLDKATVNIGTLFSKQVEGRISTEVRIVLIAAKSQNHGLEYLAISSFPPADVVAWHDAKARVLQCPSHANYLICNNFLCRWTPAWLMTQACPHTEQLPTPQRLHVQDVQQ